MPNPTMGEIADIEIPSNTTGQVVAPIGVGGVQVVAGTATPIRTYGNQGQGTWGILHPTGVIPIKPPTKGVILGTSVIQEPEIVTPIPNATSGTGTGTTGTGTTGTGTTGTTGTGTTGTGNTGGAGGSDTTNKTDSGAVIKKPNYLIYALIALGVLLVYKTFSKKKN
jgi:hypothetical protein